MELSMIFKARLSCNKDAPKKTPESRRWFFIKFERCLCIKHSWSGMLHYFRILVWHACYIIILGDLKIHTITNILKLYQSQLICLFLCTCSGEHVAICSNLLFITSTSSFWYQKSSNSPSPPLTFPHPLLLGRDSFKLSEHSTLDFWECKTRFYRDI